MLNKLRINLLVTIIEPTRTKQLKIFDEKKNNCKYLEYLQKIAMIEIIFEIVCNNFAINWEYFNIK